MKLIIFEYIEGFYNRKRIYGSINYETPFKIHNELAMSTN